MTSSGMEPATYLNQLRYRVHSVSGCGGDSAGEEELQSTRQSHWYDVYTDV
jgi:hypothetical protein